MRYHKTSLFVFGATALTSLIVNVLLVRNLQADYLESWVLAGTLTASISVLVAGTTLKDISALQRKSAETLSAITSHAELSRFPSPRQIISLIIVVATSFINFFVTYLLVFVVLSLKSARISAFLQIKGRQKELLINTLIMYISFLCLLLILRISNSLNFIFVSSSHLLCLAISLKLLEKREHAKTKKSKSVTRENFVFGFFYLTMNIDLLLANQKLLGDVFTTYSAASSFSRFSIALVSLFSLLYLSKFSAQNDAITKAVYVRNLATVMTIGILGFTISQLGINLPEQILGERFQDFLPILTLQITALIPWLFSYFYTQFCIIKAKKRLALALAFTCCLESLFVLLFVDLIVVICLVHFFFGCLLMYLLFSLSSSKTQEKTAQEYFFILGTSAEMIKMKYLVSLFPQSTVLNTKQHNLSFSEVLNHIETPFVKEVNIGSRFITYLGRLVDTPLWLTSRVIGLIFYFARIRVSNLKKSKEFYLFIHGDTLSSGLGALIGRLFNFQIIHVEAGLRTNNLLNPFPEEIIRRMNSVFANIHFAPGDNYLLNLGRYSGLKFSTGGNTFLDSLEIESLFLETSPEMHKPYIVVHLHRLELLQNKRTLDETLKEVVLLSEQFTIYLIDENHFRQSFDNLDLSFQPEKFTFLPKMSRHEFLGLCLNSEFVLSDSGGTQEELAFLGVPMLIHRKFTERLDGLGISAVLSNWESGAILNFSRKYQSFRIETSKNFTSPSKLIREILLNISNVHK
jgi:UDP-N-acetylglucosamine 2-epimerase (non-hydrolysing)